MDTWYKIQRTLVHAADSAFTDFANSIVEGNTLSLIQFSFETPVGDNEALFGYDDNPMFLSEVFEDEYEGGDEDEDDTKLDINPVLLYNCSLVLYNY